MAVPLMAGLMIAQGVMGIGSQVVGMIQQSKMAEENKKMQKKMSEDFAKSNSAITAQFAASSGLSANVGGAVGNQQQGQGGFPSYV
ncbi:hypothetical protein IV102_07255 [bacterium]|nr:hypothetical protein [bacterium]